MWISNRLLDYFKISQESFGDLKEEIAALRTERDTLKSQLSFAQTSFEWLRLRVNTLEFEKTALMERAYNIKVPAVEVVRQPILDPHFDPRNFTGFNDVGDDVAKQLGMPLYGSGDES